MKDREQMDGMMMSDSGNEQEPDPQGLERKMGVLESSRILSTAGTKRMLHLLENSFMRKMKACPVNYILPMTR